MEGSLNHSHLQMLIEQHTLKQDLLPSTFMFIAESPQVVHRIDRSALHSSLTRIQYALLSDAVRATAPFYC